MTNDAKSFYKSLFVLVGPIALQNLISAAVSSADVIMLNFVGQTSLAAVSLAGQIQFILMLFYTGLSSGLIMLTAQYWGKNDCNSIETLAGMALKISCSVGFLFGLVSIFFPALLMRIFTDDKTLIEVGSQYLRIAGASYFFLSISQVFQAVFKSIEHVKTVTVITMFALSLNIFLNAVFIFGLFGLPKLGIKGVAFATSFSRAVELLICLIISKRIPEIKLTPAILFRKNKTLFIDYFHYSMPALGNEFVWGAAFSFYSAILGRLGEDIVAANSVVAIARNLGSVLCFGMAYGGAILLGKEMGSGDLVKAKKDATRLWKTTTITGVLAFFTIIAMRPLVINIVNLEPLAEEYLGYLVYINAFSIFGAAVNTVLICGIFRAGGDAQFGLKLDSISMWCVSIPLGLIAAFVLHLPPVLVYLVLYLDEFEKMPFIIKHYRSSKWIKNITRDF